VPTSTGFDTKVLYSGNLSTTKIVGPNRISGAKFCGGSEGD